MTDYLHIEQKRKIEQLTQALEDLIEVTKSHPDFIKKDQNGNRWKAVSRAKKLIKNK